MSAKLDQIKFGLTPAQHSENVYLAIIRKYLTTTFLILTAFLTTLSAQAPQDTVLERFLMHDDINRRYQLYIPSDYAGEPLPLVINFHVFGSSDINQMNIHSQMNFVADTARFLVAYPRGGPVTFPGTGTNTGWAVPGFIPFAGQDDVDFTDSLIAHINADFDVNMSRVYAAGYSNGGQMALYLACKRPDVFAAVAAVSAPMHYDMFDSCASPPVKPVLLIRGTEDPYVPYSGIPGLFPPEPASIDFWVDANQCLDSTITELPDIEPADSCTVTLIEYTSCESYDGKINNVHFYRVNNGGHGWPRPGGPSFFGFTNEDINGSSVIWNFFKSYQHPDYVGSIDNHSENKPKSFQLSQNYPNPFNPATTIAYRLDKAADVGLTIYNLLGQPVITLVEEMQPAGEYTVRWNGKDARGKAMPSGTYFYAIQVDNTRQVKQMTLLK